MKKTPTRKDIEGPLSFYGIKKTAVEIIARHPDGITVRDKATGFVQNLRR